MILDPFLHHYTPFESIPADQEVIRKYESIIPVALIELWKNHGLGKYNDGILEICNPSEYQDTLWTWLGKEVDTYVPIALSGFGCLFYYRKLTESDEDVCILNPHYRKISVCTWSLVDFFNTYLCNADIISTILKKDLFQQATEKFGILKQNEIFYFAPALVIGGAEDIKYVDKGIGKVHLHLLFQMGA